MLLLPTGSDIRRRSGRLKKDKKQCFTTGQKLKRGRGKSTPRRKPVRNQIKLKIKSPKVKVENQPSSSNSILEEEGEVIRWNEKDYKCSEILKKRRRLPDYFRFADRQKQEALEEAYSRCKTADADVISSIRANNEISEKGITQWFKCRRAYDFEEDDHSETYNQKLSQAWIFFGQQLQEREDLLELVASWAEVPMDEAIAQVKSFSEKFPEIVFKETQVLLRDLLEHIDVFFMQLPKNLEKIQKVQDSLEKTFVNWYFHNAKVLDEEMMAENEMTEKEVMKWLEARMKCGLENKRRADRVGTNSRIKLVKLSSLFKKIVGKEWLRIVAKWAGCSQVDVVYFYRKRAEDESVREQAVEQANKIHKIQIERKRVEGEAEARTPTVELIQRSQKSQELKAAVKDIYKTRKFWSYKEKEEFCEQHPEATIDWLNGYLKQCKRRETNRRPNFAKEPEPIGGENEPSSSNSIQEPVSPEARKEAEEPMEEEQEEPVTPAVQHQPSSRNLIPEEEEDEVIFWKEKVYTCSDILNHRRRLPSYLQLIDKAKQEKFLSAYSRCKTADDDVILSITSSTQTNAEEITDWFRRRRAYDFEEEVPTDAYNQKISQAWLYFGHQLDEEEELLKLIANWAKVPIDQARKEVTSLTKTLPQVALGDTSVPLRDFLEHIDMFFSIESPKSLEKSPEVQHSLEQRFINWYFHNAIVYDKEMMVETGMKEMEVVKWLDERMKCGLKRKKDAAGSNKFTRVKLIKFWTCVQEISDGKCLEMVAKWARCTEDHVLNFYKERNAASVKGAREQGDHTYAGPRKSVAQLLREDLELLRRTESAEEEEAPLPPPKLARTPQKVRVAIQEIYKIRKRWNSEERKEFHEQHPEAKDPWLINNLKNLRIRDKRIEGETSLERYWVEMERKHHGHEHDVVKFYREREQVVEQAEGNTVRVEGVRELEDQGEQIRHEHHYQNCSGQRKAPDQLLREEVELIKRTGSAVHGHSGALRDVL